jgi:hypothetical protein
MTVQKGFKRLVRARMRKTGESYAAARARLVSEKPAAKSAPTKANYALTAGMSDAKVAAATGCTWERWVKALDRHKAYELPHRDIAKLIAAKYKTPSWWTQMVTVGYERIKGLRARGQQRSGSFQISKSKTLSTTVAAARRAWIDTPSRKTWLDANGFELKSGPRSKSLRFTWKDQGTVIVMITPKGDDRCVLSVEHQALPDKAAADRMKAFWTTQLGQLAEAVKG